MYAALLTEGFIRMRRRLWHEAVKRSGLLTIVGLSLMLLLLTLGWREHMRGHFAKLKAELKGRSVQHEPAAVRPGGQEAVVLQRSPLPGVSGPEFLSATLLPGRGMNVLQITAYLPDKGEVPLLVSPSLEDAAHLLGGPGVPAAPGAALTVGGAIEAPWASRIFGVESADGENLITTWHGRRLSLPTDSKQRNGFGGAVAVGGLLLSRASNEVKTNVMPDGGVAQATFHAGSFDEHWISHTDVTTTVQLSSRAIEMKVIARNTGNEAEPIGIGWRPRFAILSGNRGKATLRLPNGLRAEVRDHRSGLPGGKLLPVEGTEYDFTKPEGTPLGALNLDDSFVHLRPALLDNGPAAELRDPESDYGLRVTAISSTIKAMRIYAPAGAAFVSIDPQFNYDDPFGQEWPRDEDTGMVVLQPGQSTQWTIRLEIFSLKTSDQKPF
jgi:aldose 1-epimerase